MLPGSTWHPTPALVRAALGSAALAVTAVVMGRPDLLVLAAPLLVHAVAAVVRRPATVPRAGDAVLGTDHVREGEGTTVRVLVDARRRRGARRARADPAPAPGGAAGLGDRRRGPSRPDADRLELAVPVASLRWGRRRVGDGLVAATTPWAGYLWGPLPVTPQHLTTLPQPGLFDSRAASPHPIGLVGQHPARRRGDGSEFESIRPFQPGDRLRRVQWRVSLRTGKLHATSTVAEEDASVLLLVDSGVEVGDSGGVTGAASTLDVAVRAAGAVAEHYLVRGDRVGLRRARLDRPQRRAHRRGAPAPAPAAGHAGPRRTGGEPRRRPGADAVPGARREHRAGVLADAVPGGGGGHHDARVARPRRGGRGLPARRRRGGTTTAARAGLADAAAGARGPAGPGAPRRHPGGRLARAGHARRGAAPAGPPRRADDGGPA